MTPSVDEVIAHCSISVYLSNNLICRNASIDHVHVGVGVGPRGLLVNIAGR